MISSMNTLDGELQWEVIPESDGIVTVRIIHKQYDEKYTGVKDDYDCIHQVIADFLMVKVGDGGMSNTEFVANNGRLCPVCESRDVRTAIGMVENFEECESCGAKWDNVYKLVSYENLIKGDE